LNVLSEREDIQKLEDQIDNLIGQVKDLQEKLGKKFEKESRRLSMESTDTLKRIRNFIGHSGDLVNKARLFDARVLKEGS